MSEALEIESLTSSSTTATTATTNKESNKKTKGTTKSRFLFGMICLVIIFLVIISSAEWKSESTVRTSTETGHIDYKKEQLAKFQREQGLHNSVNNNSNNNNNNNNNPPVVDHIVRDDAPIHPTDDDDDDETTRQYQYKRRGKEIKEAFYTEMVEQWGSWTYVDERTSLPNNFYLQFPNRDVPLTKFPSTAWQLNPTYLKAFLTESLTLINRTLEAILAEYGQAGPAETYGERSRMFRLITYDDDDDDKVTMDSMKIKEEKYSGGWTTKKSWKGLQRRILHAIMTEDSFVFAMGGHSAAAGHGNLFQQSYTLQVQRVMEPVFARLGVYHEARNFGNGGLGTLHNALAAGSLYGPDVDVLMWDAGMTENNPRDLDLFARQGILGGSRVPVLWNLPPDTLKMMYVHADADVGGMFIKELPIPKAQNRTHLDELPYAVQYMKCDNSIDKDFCKPREYRGVCWIDRDDFVPTTPQNKHPGSRVSWHPGFRVHQFKGRILAFTLLEALKEALEYWNGLEDLVLPEDAWHVTAHYENIRNKVQNLDPSIGRCYKFEGDLPTRVCKYPMKGRTEYTPRAYPALSSIRSLMPTAMAASINPAEDKIYNPPDVYNQHLHPGFKAIDVVGISESGVDYRQFTAPSYESYYKSTSIPDTAKSADLWEDPGQGITLGNHATDYLCDGTYNSFCNRGTRNKCLLSAHNDGRGGLLLDSFSGWMLLDIPNVEHGVIILNMEIWHTESPRTEGWTSINNENVEQRGRSLSNSTVLREPSKRRASEPEEFFCDDFIFECSINGVLHRYNKQEFLVKKKKLQRVVTTFSLLDDESFRSEQVKLAFRLVGCARNSAIKVTHVYWA